MRRSGLPDPLGIKRHHRQHAIGPRLPLVDASVAVGVLFDTRQLAVLVELDAVHLSVRAARLLRAHDLGARWQRGRARRRLCSHRLVRVELAAVDHAVEVVVELRRKDLRAPHFQPGVGLTVMVPVVGDTLETPELVVARLPRPARLPLPVRRDRRLPLLRGPPPSRRRSRGAPELKIAKIRPFFWIIDGSYAALRPLTYSDFSRDRPMLGVLGTYR